MIFEKKNLQDIYYSDIKLYLFLKVDSFVAALVWHIHHLQIMALLST